ncbi:MAG: TRAP transporter small permease subunit [Rubrivivax sp.]|nr:TRAP transporter small permease subunit [Rubrivivax sp.]
MQLLLMLSRWVDALNDRFARLAEWAVLAACLISAGNAFVRYGLSISSNAFLEIQWYLFAACVMLGAAQVLRVNEHVRVDVLYGLYPTRLKVFVDLMGLLLFLIPVMVLSVVLSWPLFVNMFVSGEMSSQAGGLVRWPAMLLLPLGMGLLVLQAVAEVIKRVGWLMRLHEMDTHYERPLQ